MPWAPPGPRSAVGAALLALLFGAGAAEARSSASSCRAGAAACELVEEAAEVSLLQRLETQERVSVEDEPVSVCEEVGARAWITSAGINSVLEQIWPTLLEKASRYTWPPIEGESNGWKWSASGVTMVHYNMEVPKVDLTEGATVKLKILGFHIDSRFDYRVDGTSIFSWIWSEGQVRAELKQTEEIDGEITIIITPEGKPQVKMTVGKLAFKLGGFLIDGSVFAGLMEFLVSIFQEKVEAAVSDAARKIVDQAVNDYVNKLLDQIDFKIPVPISEAQHEVDAADLSLCYAEVVDGHVAVGVSGAIFDPAQPAKKMYKGAPMALSKEPPRALKEGGGMVAVQLTSYTPNTGFAVLQEHGFLDRTIQQSDLPPDSATLKFDLDTARDILPDLDGSRAAPAANFFKVRVSSETPPTVTFEHGDVNIHGEVRMLLKWADGPRKDRTFLECTAPFEGSAKMMVVDEVVEGAEQETVHLTVQYVKSSPIKIMDQHLHTRIARLNKLVEEVAETVLMPYINMLLQKGIAVHGKNGLHMAKSKVVVEEGDVIATSTVNVDMAAFNAFADRAFV